MMLQEHFVGRTVALGPLAVCVNGLVYTRCKAPVVRATRLPAAFVLELIREGSFQDEFICQVPEVSIVFGLAFLEEMELEQVILD